MSVDFKEQLKRQLRFLQASCDVYDTGTRDEAIRIGVTLRVLFHSTGSSTSLLSHLGATNIKLLSTCDKIPKGAPFFHNLTVIEFDPSKRTFDCRPKLATAQTKTLVTFEKWWDNEVVYLYERFRKIRRKALIIYAANKDGGAHVDSTLPAEYEKVIDGLRWSVNIKPVAGPETDLKLKHAQFAPLRQMAYEVLNSPALLKLAV